MQHFVLFFAWAPLFSKNFCNFAGQEGIINNRCGTKITVMDSIKGIFNSKFGILVKSLIIGFVIPIVFFLKIEDTLTRVIILLVFFFGALIYYIYALRNNLLKKNLNNYDFFNYWKEPIYIPLDITTDFEGKGERKPLNTYLLSMIKEEQQESRYTCIMGDTGSGKTDALVHFLEEYVGSSFFPSEIRLYTLKKGYNKVLEAIQKEYPNEESRKKCVLLLDALDECEEARKSLENTPDNNPSTFINKLYEDTKNFAWVIVTCRKQFFMREEYLPGKMDVEIGNPQDLDNLFLHWQKLYIAPFSDKQVDEYLLRKFGVTSGKETCEEARRIVDLCEDVFLRPMILSHIDIVMKVYAQRQKPLTMKDIYDAIVYYWIQREAKNKPEEIERLLNVSIATAGYMYKNNLNSLDDEHYREFCREYKIDDRDNLIRVKSLLTNDKDGFRFSHKSFYDFLLAYWLFLNPWDIDSVLGLDFTLEIYQGIYEAYKSQGESSGIEKCLKVRNVPIYTVAAGLYKLAYELKFLNHFNSAEPLYQEALDIYRKLAEKYIEPHLPDVAGILNNLAILHYDTNHHEEAEEEYQEALNIRRKLAEKNPDAFMPDVAMTLNNLANLHDKTNHHEEAEKEFQEALDIHRKLAEKNPDAFMPYVATTLNNLAVLHKNTNHYEEAEEEYQEALNIRRKLAEKNPDAFLPGVAMTLNNLANLHRKTNHYKEAEREYQEALDIYRKLAEKTPDAFMPRVADTLYNFALLHLKQNNLEKAEAEAQESLEISQEMAEISHEAFDKDVEDASKLLDDIRKKQAASSDIQESTEP